MILTERGVGDAIQEFIEKEEKEAIAEIINFQINKMQVSSSNISCYPNKWPFLINNHILKLQKSNT